MLIALHIHKESMFIKISFAHQRLEKTIASLTIEQHKLEEQLAKAKQRTAVAADARARGMHPMRVSALKKLADLEEAMIAEKVSP